VAAGGLTLSEPAALSRQAELMGNAGAGTANLPPCGGDAREGRGGRCPAGVSANEFSAQTDVVEARAAPNPKRPKSRKPARTLPPAWLALRPVGIHLELMTAAARWIIAAKL
jgi:GcrA cell cycle regulator